MSRLDRTYDGASRRRKRAVVLAAGAAGSLALIQGAAFADVATVSGEAFGASVSITSPLPISVPKTADAVLPPNGSSPVNAAAATVGPSPLISFGAATGHVDGHPDPSGVVNANASVASLLLGPLGAGVITSKCSADGGTPTGSSTIANITGLPQGVTISGNPNQAIPIPLLGTITINEQIVTGPSIVVSAIHYHGDASKGDLLTGDIYVAQSACHPAPSSSVPVGTVGGLALTVVVGGALAGTVVFSRRRRTAAQPA